MYKTTVQELMRFLLNKNITFDIVNDDHMYIKFNYKGGIRLYRFESVLDTIEVDFKV